MFKRSTFLKGILRKDFILVLGACTVTLGGTSSSVFAAGSAVGCDGVTVWVAPGGEVVVPVECRKAFGYDAPTYVVRRDVRGMSIAGVGTLADGVTVFDPVKTPYKGVSSRLRFEASKAAMKDGEITVGGLMIVAGSGVPLNDTASQDAKVNVNIDTSGTKAPLCRDVTASVNAGETVDIPLSCVGPDVKTDPGKKLMYELADAPTKGSVISIDQNSGTARYVAGVYESGQGQIHYRAKTQDTTQVSNTATASVEIHEKSAEPTNKAPVCDNKEQRIKIVYVLVEKGDKDHEGRADLDFFNPRQLQLSCQDPEGQPLRYELASKLTYGQLDALNPGTGTVMWKGLALDSKYRWKKVGEPLPTPWQSYPDELKIDTRFPIVLASPPKGFDETFQYQAVDPQGNVSNVASFTVKERTTGCLVVNIGPAIGRVSEMRVPMCEDGKYPGADWGPEDMATEDAKGIPFTNDPLKSCVNPIAANEQPRTVTNVGKLKESKITLRAPQLVVRSQRQNVVLKAALKGKFKLAKNEWLNIYIDRKSPEAFLEENSGLSKLDKEPTNGKFPYKLSVPARRLKAGLHTFHVITGRSNDRDGKHDKVIAKVRFRVVECEPVRLVVSGRRQVQAKFAGASAVAKSVSFRLPAGSVKSVRVGKTRVVLSKRKSAVTRNGLRIVRRGKTLKISGQRIALKSIVVKFSGRSRKGKYRALVTGQNYRLKFTTAAKTKR